MGCWGTVCQDSGRLDEEELHLLPGSRTWPLNPGWNLTFSPVTAAAIGEVRVNACHADLSLCGCTLLVVHGVVLPSQPRAFGSCCPER